MSASVKQLPAALALECIAGNPFAITITATGATVATPVVAVSTSTGTTYTSNPPDVTLNGSDISVAWTAADTAAMNTTTRGITYKWSVQSLVDGDGPFELVAKTLTVHPVGTSGVSSTTAATLAVTVGTGSIALTVNPGVNGGDIDGGTPTDVYSSSDAVDGGTP